MHVPVTVLQVQLTLVCVFTNPPVALTFPWRWWTCLAVVYLSVPSAMIGQWCRLWWWTRSANAHSTRIQNREKNKILFFSSQKLLWPSKFEQLGHCKWNESVKLHRGIYHHANFERYCWSRLREKTSVQLKACRVQKCIKYTPKSPKTFCVLVCHTHMYACISLDSHSHIVCMHVNRFSPCFFSQLREASSHHSDDVHLLHSLYVLQRGFFGYHLQLFERDSYFVFKLKSFWSRIYVM